MDIENILNITYILPNESLSYFSSKFSLKKFKKGTILFDSKNKKQPLFLIKKGIVRAYIDSLDNDVTFWFGSEGDPILSMRSYVENKTSYETIELLEDCEIYFLEMDVLQSLFSSDINIANWGRKFAEKELLKSEERFISKQFKTAIVRYKELLDSNPKLIQRVALRHIASYLGITQGSLSRIRAEIR